MQEMHTFVRDEVLPSWWANSIQRFLSVGAAGFTLTKADATHLQVTASADEGAAVIAIAGLWRWVESTVTRAHPGGSAGTFDVFVTAVNNDIVSTPAAFTDITNYAFALAILAHGSTPSIVPGTVDQFREIGSCEWDGTAITSVTQTVPSVALHASTHATGGDDPIAPADIGAATASALSTEVTRATTAEGDEITARAAADAAEAAARGTADAAEAAARVAGDANNPSAGQKAALPGTSGTPGSGNKYVTDADPRNVNTRLGQIPEGLESALPAPTVALAQTLYFATDTTRLWRCRDDGSVWDSLGTLGAAGVGGSIVQNGVVSSGDLLVSAISINTATCAITATPASTSTSAWVSVAGLLAAVNFVAAAKTPAALAPASTKYAVITFEMDAAGAITSVKGADTATQLNTAALIAANAPAVSANKLQIASFAVWNNAGAMQFGDHTTVATRGVNWIDRRPNARGATFGNSLLTTVTTSLTDAVRMECTGAPILLSGTAGPVPSSAGNGGFNVVVTDNGTQIINTGATAGTANGLLASASRLYTPSAGSHLFVFTLSEQAGGGTSSMSFYWWMREQAVSAFTNGSV